MPRRPATSSQDTPAVADQLAAIADVAQLYFDGIHYGDVAKLERVFDADAHLIGEVNGQPYRKHRDEYIEIVRTRPAPASLGAPFRMWILSIDVAYHPAVAKLFTPVGATEYVDYLSLQRIAGTWMVVHKLFSNEVAAAG
jgi:protease I